jgi:hypothetical protein
MAYKKDRPAESCLGVARAFCVLRALVTFVFVEQPKGGYDRWGSAGVNRRHLLQIVFSCHPCGLYCLTFRFVTAGYALVY